MAGRQAAGGELALERLGLRIGRAGAGQRIGQAVEERDLALRRQLRVIGNVVAGADEIVEGQDRAAMTGMDQVRGDGKILDAMEAVAMSDDPELEGKVAFVYTNPLSKGGSSSGHYGGNAETYMNVGEAMGKAMVELLKAD